MFHLSLILFILCVTILDDGDTESDVEIDQNMSFYFDEGANSTLDASLEGTDSAPLCSLLADILNKSHRFAEWNYTVLVTW